MCFLSSFSVLLIQILRQMVHLKFNRFKLILQHSKSVSVVSIQVDADMWICYLHLICISFSHSNWSTNSCSYSSSTQWFTNNLSIDNYSYSYKHTLHSYISSCNGQCSSSYMYLIVDQYTNCHWDSSRCWFWCTNRFCIRWSTDRLHRLYGSKSRSVNCETSIQ